MRNLKPSQLPANTVIDTENGEYIKRVEGYWEDLFSGCGCCVDRERIADAGCTDIHKRYEMGLTTGKASDEYFAEYMVIALPPGCALDTESLHGAWDRKAWLYSDGTGMHDCGGVNCDA
jgi:hypothetical protein